MIVLKVIDKILAEIIVFLIKIYQFTISPDKGLPSLRLKGKICSHYPHCSQYSINCLKRYGFIKGIPKMTERVVSCTPSKEKIYDPEYYKIVFFSGAPIGVPFLHELQKDKRFEIVGVVTMPDAPSGRGMEAKPNIIKTEAEKIIANHKENTANEFIKTPNSLRLDPKKHSEEAHKFKLRLEAKNPDYLVVIAYGKIIPQYILDIAQIAPINVHGSLLPKYRGASPLQSVFLNQERQTGITIMKMDANMDTGNMIDMLKFDIEFNWTVKDLIEKIMQKGPQFLNNTLQSFGKKQLGEVKQDENKATYCQKIEKEDGEINPYKDSIQEIYNKYRGYYIRPKIFFQNLSTQKRVIIENLKLDQKLFESEKNKPLFIENELNKCILDISLKPEGKKLMDRQSFKSGYLKSSK
ncbi:MAG TPA: membrane protein insertion efficiency factor YidD [Candidatus Absconditabacterales bacterium]|nr:membrane protein insertion efficiency factor YidD [Candidatus Absconditabacterales bacterium]HOQ78789.1 membrane protein insertion efficiency factor YidD [Candidatus Absconditabacterales bacterium]HPK27604.1 membrane protein insertion efficiency factor YidD [Candidatus Absconditabacterales bacterium]